MAEERCIRCGHRVPWISLWGNCSITVFKLTIGLLGNSTALIADAFHSLSDVIGTGSILLSRIVSNRPEDEDHPYGHGKIEFIGAIVVYAILVFIAGSIFVEGLRKVLSGDPGKPHFSTVLGAVISIYYNFIMYELGQCAGERNHSPALMANSFESRADAISSLAVVIGILIAIFAYPMADPIAAMIVGVIIFVNCVIQMKSSLAELMDRALTPGIVERIERVVLAQKGVAGVDFVKSRRVGPKYWVDLGIQVPRDLKISQSDAIAAVVRTELMRRSEQIYNVEVFVAPATATPGSRTTL